MKSLKKTHATKPEAEPPGVLQNIAKEDLYG
jgi:hypothetical protein